MKATVKILPALILATSLSGIAHADAPTYTVTDLGGIPDLGAPYLQFNGANSTGAVVGYIPTSSDGSTQHAYYYYSGSAYDLGTLGGTNSTAYGINTARNIVGESSISGDDATHAYYFDGSMHDLGTLGGDYSTAHAINDNSAIVGGSNTSDGNYHAFLYNGSMHDLGGIGGSLSDASAINNAGKIVGWATTENDAEYHAFLYDGLMHDLGTLGGTDAAATKISSNGLVIGNSLLAEDLVQHAFLYDGAMHDLGTLGGDWSNALGVNDQGLVIGVSSINADGNTAFFLYDGTKMYNLDSLLANSAPHLDIATLLSIDDSGNIIALGFDFTGDTPAYHLLQLNMASVPAPASAWLFGSCLTGLIGLRRKSKNS